MPTNDADEYPVATASSALKVEADALYVVNGGSASVSVIDVHTNIVIGTISLRQRSWPHHVYASADGSKLLVAAPGMDMSGGHHGGHDMPGRIFVLDAVTGALLAETRTPSMNHNAIYSPDGTEIWTSAMKDDGAVHVFDAETLTIKATIEVESNPTEVTFSLDGARAFVANSGGSTLSVVDVATKTVSHTIEVGQNPVGAWQGANGVAYVDGEESKSLLAIDTTTLEIVRQYALGFTPGYAALAPDQKSVWVTNADAGSAVLKGLDSDETLAEIPTGDGAHAIVFSADGTRAYVSNQFADTVSVIDVESRTVLTEIAVGKKPNGLLFRQVKH